MFHRVFVDTNVLLDVVLNREPFITDANEIFQMQEDGLVTIYISSLTVANTAHIVKGNGKNPFRVVEHVVKWVNVIDLKLAHIEMALQSQFRDFEDGLQFFCASEISNMDAIITRNKPDFRPSTIPVYTPREFLKYVNS